MFVHVRGYITVDNADPATAVGLVREHLSALDGYEDELMVIKAMPRTDRQTALALVDSLRVEPTKSSVVTFIETLARVTRTSVHRSP